MQEYVTLILSREFTLLPPMKLEDRRRPGRSSLATQNAHGHRSGPLRGPPRYPCAFCWGADSLKSGEKVRKCAEICVFEVHGGGESKYLQQYYIGCLRGR